MIEKKYIGYGIAIVIVVILIVFVGGLVLYSLPKSGAFAGFTSKYRGLDPYLDVDPIVRFFYANRELRKKVETGTVIIDEVYFIYKQFVNSPNLENVPIDILKEASRMTAFMESGRDFSGPESVDFRPLGQGIIGMDRLLSTYLDSLKLTKNKVGGTDPNEEKVYSDFIKIGGLRGGYIDGVLGSLDIDQMYGNDTKRAREVKEDLVEQVGLQLQLTQADPVRYEQNEYEYQNNLAEGLNKDGKFKSAGTLYIDKRFPGTFERRQIRDEPTYQPDKNYKDPNVPRPGIIGRVSDNPYHYDIHAKNYIRSL